MQHRLCLVPGAEGQWSDLAHEGLLVAWLLKPDKNRARAETSSLHHISLEDAQGLALTDGLALADGASAIDEGVRLCLLRALQI